MRRLVEDDVADRALRATERARPRGRGSIDVEELTSRKSAARHPGDARPARRRASHEQRTRRKGDAPLPIDVLLATNMISVGVDVRRLGLMVVAGQPKTTAEYIQATSRVGRDQAPGWCSRSTTGRGRATCRTTSASSTTTRRFYRQVEALSVTPFAPRALDRGLTGVLVSLLRLSEPDWNANRGAGDGRPRRRARVAGASRRSATRADDQIGQQAARTTLDRARRPRCSTRGSRRQARRPARRSSTSAAARATPTSSPAAGARASTAGTTWTVPTSLRDVEPAVPLALRPRRHRARRRGAGEAPERRRRCRAGGRRMRARDARRRAAPEPAAAHLRRRRDRRAARADDARARPRRLAARRSPSRSSRAAAARRGAGQRAARRSSELAHAAGASPEGDSAGVPGRAVPALAALPALQPAGADRDGLFELRADPWRPERTTYVHAGCPKSHRRRPPTAFPARYLVACEDGHLDDFPWVEFLHGGDPMRAERCGCASSAPAARAGDVQLSCDECRRRRRLSQAFGEDARPFLPPRCRGRHPHLGIDRARLRPAAARRCCSARATPGSRSSSRRCRSRRARASWRRPSTRRGRPRAAAAASRRPRLRARARTRAQEAARARARRSASTRSRPPSRRAATGDAGRRPRGPAHARSGACSLRPGRRTRDRRLQAARRRRAARLRGRSSRTSCSSSGCARSARYRLHPHRRARRPRRTRRHDRAARRAPRRAGCRAARCAARASSCASRRSASPPGSATTATPAPAKALREAHRSWRARRNLPTRGRLARRALRAAALLRPRADPRARAGVRLHRVVDPRADLRRRPDATASRWPASCSTPPPRTARARSAGSSASASPSSSGRCCATRSSARSCARRTRCAPSTTRALTARSTSPPATPASSPPRPRASAATGSSTAPRSCRRSRGPTARLLRRGVSVDRDIERVLDRLSAAQIESLAAAATGRATPDGSLAQSVVGAPARRPRRRGRAGDDLEGDTRADRRRDRAGAAGRPARAGRRRGPRAPARSGPAPERRRAAAHRERPPRARRRRPPPRAARQLRRSHAPQPGQRTSRPPSAAAASSTSSSRPRPTAPAATAATRHDRSATCPGIRRWRWPAEQRTHGAVLHAKALIIDGERALVGSANLTKRALTANLELGVLIRDPALATALEMHLDRLMDRAILTRVEPT